MLRRRIFLLTVVATLAATTTSFGGTAAASIRVAHAATPFTTSERPYLVALAPGVQIQPILSTGDVIGGTKAGYQMSGVPDGIGMYASTDHTLEVFMNHELAARFDPSGARVSHLTLNADGAVVAASYPIDGTEGFEWFCSGTLTTLDGVPWYTAGEESIHSARMGGSFALNALTGRYIETPQFGHLSHENVVPVQGLSRAYVGLSEDGFGELSQLYAYLAADFSSAFAGDGVLRVWVPDEPVTDGNPSSNDIAKGETMAGHFVRIPHGDRVLPRDLEAMVQSMGAFDFNRIEDQTADPNHPGTIYFSETGVANQETTHGRIYRLDVNPANPRHATLSVVLSAAEGDDIAQPDNLGISDRSLLIQEDRNWKHSGYNRLLMYDLATGSLTPVARADPSQDVIDLKGPGALESSGVVDASGFFGQGWWLLDVQAHYTDVPVPGPSLEPNSSSGEGGQLQLVYIPGS